jgi:hypothetical protein
MQQQQQQQKQQQLDTRDSHSNETYHFVDKESCGKSVQKFGERSLGPHDVSAGASEQRWELVQKDSALRKNRKRI